jgi:hypothetical protein
MLRAVCTHSSADISAVLDDLIKSHVSWRTVPPFRRPGRTAWVPLTECSGAIKLKGVGLWNPRSPVLYGGVRGEEVCDWPVPPMTRIYRRKSDQLHFGFDEGGGFCLKAGAETPAGGMRHDKAQAEYDNGIRLNRKGVPAIAPLMVLRYEDLLFNDAPMGAVASFVSDSYPFGLESILFRGVFSYPGADEYFNGVASSLGRRGNSDDDSSRFGVVSLVYEQIGRLCGSFADSYLFRHSGGLNNFYFDRSSGQVFFTDLDSSLQLEQIPAVRRGWETLRDLISVIHKLFLHFGILCGYGVAGLREIREHDIVGSLLRGYFGGGRPDRIASTAEGLTGVWEGDFATLAKKLPRTAGVEPRLSMRRDWFYIHCLWLLAPWFVECPHGLEYQSYMRHSDVVERARLYLADDFAEFSKATGLT